MELRQLRYVVAVAEEGTFTAAAARVHVAQPAVSQQIARLERELGAKLFDRSERRARLTAAGEAFMPHARAALAATTAGADAVETLHGDLAGDLNIGTIPSPPEWLTRNIGEFAARHPKVRLTVDSGHPEGLATDVATHALDIAVIGVSGGRLPAGPAGQRLRSVLASQRIATEPLVVIVPADHRLADAAEATLLDLSDDAHVTLTQGSGLRAVLEAASAAAGFAPRITAETDDLNLLPTLVAQQLGVAVLPRSTAQRSNEPVATLRLRAPLLHRDMVVVWHRHDVTAPARAFLDLAQASDEAQP